MRRGTVGLTVDVHIPLFLEDMFEVIQLTALKSSEHSLKWIVHVAVVQIQHILWTSRGWMGEEEGPQLSITTVKVSALQMLGRLLLCKSLLRSSTRKSLQA